MPENKLTGFSMRPGTAGDLPLVKEICANIYGGNDYIPHVWEEWSNNPQNQAFIIEADRTAAGIFWLRLNFAGSNTGWLQGVRVKAAYRNQGMGRYIMEQAVNLSRELGLQTLQFATARDNYAMHRLAGLFGFWLVGNFLNYNFERTDIPPRGNALESRMVTTSEFDEAYRLILDSEDYRLGHGVYCNAWNWKPLSMDAFRKHLERREVYCLVGALKVLAIVRRTEARDYWLTFLAGEKASRQPLLLELARRVAKNMGTGQKIQYTAQVVQTPANETLLQQTGFKPDDHEPGLLLYELNLQPPVRNLPPAP